jgi:hypothetical protein
MERGEKVQEETGLGLGCVASNEGAERVSSLAQKERCWRVNMPVEGSSGGSRGALPTVRLVGVALVDKNSGIPRFLKIEAYAVPRLHRH